MGMRRRDGLAGAESAGNFGFEHLAVEPVDLGRTARMCPAGMVKIGRRWLTLFMAVSYAARMVGGLAVASDLKIFFGVVAKAPAEGTAADVSDARTADGKAHAAPFRRVRGRVPPSLRRNGRTKGSTIARSCSGSCSPRQRRSGAQPNGR